MFRFCRMRLAESRRTSVEQGAQIPCEMGPIPSAIVVRHQAQTTGPQVSVAGVAVIVTRPFLDARKGDAQPLCQAAG